MAQFFLDKDTKVPLYLQLKDQIMYYISTGALGAGEQLPPVKVLAKTLGINFLTVRKAYKELEHNGLLDVRHGEGTFISLTNSSARKLRKSNGNKNLIQTDTESLFGSSLRNLLEQFSTRGLDLETQRTIVEKTFADLERESVLPTIIFTECNYFQINQIGEILEDELKLEVNRILIADLETELSKLIRDGRDVNIVTTGFHVNEVRTVVADAPVQIDVLITNLNSETRRQLESVGENGSYSFICRDQESAVLYKDLLRAELGYKQMHLTSCTLAETKKVRAILDSSDVILVSPPVYEEVRRLAPRGRAVYNLFERVDPMSLKVVRDRILGKSNGTDRRSSDERSAI